jgi:YD repeat-containing protein
VLWAPTGYSRDGSSSAYDPVALQPERGYFSQLPFEHIDMVNGNLLLSFSDVSLPGNAGMDLRLVSSYNHGNTGWNQWTFGLDGAPNFVDDSGIDTIFHDADGGTHLAFPVPGSSDQFLTRDFWKWTRSTKTLQLPNGWTATYAGDASFAHLQVVSDPFGNSLTPTFGTHEGCDVLQSVVQSLGSGESRTVTLGYSTNSGQMPTSVTAAGHTWTYEYTLSSPYNIVEMTAMHPPAGPAWLFDYSNGLTVTMPTGGTVHYDFENQSTNSSLPWWVVRHRITGGRAVTGGTWTFGYIPSTSSPVATIDTPDGLHVEYDSSIFAQYPVGVIPLLMQRIVSRSGTEVAHVANGYTYLGFMVGQTWTVPVVSSRVIAQDGQTYTTTLGYSAYQFGDWHHPSQITQSDGSLTRTSSRSYVDSYDFGPYLLGRPQSEAVTVSSNSGESLTSSWAYDLSTGFVTQTTTNGVTTSFAPDGFGNRASVTDANNHTTSVTHDWGVIQNTSTPQYTVSRSINTDGTVASETRRGNTTLFTYDGLGRVTQVAPPVGAATTTSYDNGSGAWVMTAGGRATRRPLSMGSAAPSRP